MNIFLVSLVLSSEQGTFHWTNYLYVFLPSQKVAMLYSHQCLHVIAEYINYNWNSLDVDWMIDCELIGSLWLGDRYEMAIWITIPKGLNWSCGKNKAVLSSSTMYYEEESHIYMRREELKKIINLLVPTVSFPIYSKFGIILKSLEWLC